MGDEKAVGCLSHCTYCLLDGRNLTLGDDELALEVAKAAETHTPTLSCKSGHSVMILRRSGDYSDATPQDVKDSDGGLPCICVTCCNLLLGDLRLCQRCFCLKCGSWCGRDMYCCTPGCMGRCVFPVGNGQCGYRGGCNHPWCEQNFAVDDTRPEWAEDNTPSRDCECNKCIPNHDDAHDTDDESEL